MPADGEASETPDLELGPAGRARLYLEQAQALEREMGETSLPQLRDKLRGAAERFRALAAAEKDMLARREGPAAGARPDVMVDETAGRLLEFLRSGPAAPGRPGPKPGSHQRRR